MTRARWITTLRGAVSAKPALAAVASVVAYLLLQVYYVTRLPLIADEFDGAYDVYQLRTKLPYVDFKPYKTVLGYYMELPPLLLADRVWQGLIGTKLALAALNAALTLATGWLLARRFSARSVLLALPLWVFMSDWLERSSELRVDTLTAWGGIFSLLALLAWRPALAGVLAGVSFLISQKGVYFAVAGGAGLLTVALLAPNGGSRVRAIVRFSIACGLTVAGYMLLWSVISSLHATTAATFLSHRAIALEDIYPHIRRFWWQTVSRNPVYYALALFALGWLGVRAFRKRALQQDPTEHARDALLFGYAALFSACLVWHKQPWPYFFVLLVPTAFVLHVWLFDNAFRAYQRWASERAPTAANPRLPRRLLLLALAAIAIGGVLLPLSRVKALKRQHSDYQRTMVNLAEALLAPDEYYLAAADLLYNRTQSSIPLRRVALARRRELGKHPGTWTKVVLKELAERPPKLLIRNERFDAFPKYVAKYLRANYAPFWGAIEIYAPQVARGSSKFTLKFDGEYRWLGTRRRSATIGDETVEDGGTIVLDRGPIEIESKGGRLQFQPNDLAESLTKRFPRRRNFYSDSYGR